jgi:hypothetical protein
MGRRTKAALAAFGRAAAFFALARAADEPLVVHDEIKPRRLRALKTWQVAVVLFALGSSAQAAPIAWEEYRPMLPNGGEFACLLARAGTESVEPEKERVYFQLFSTCKLPVNFRCSLTIGRYNLPAFDVKLAPQASTGLDEHWVDIRPTENYSVNVLSSPCSIWFGNRPKPANPTIHYP